MSLLRDYTSICRLTEGVGEGHSGDGKAMRDCIGDVLLENCVAAAEGTHTG